MCDGIGVTRPTFHWAWALGPTRGQTRGETEIHRAEVLISGSGCFWYGKIKRGQLYAVDARPWQRLWLRVLSGRRLNREQQIEFNNARVLARRPSGK